MGPRSLKRGNRLVRRFLEVALIASMGPRSLKRGNARDEKAKADAFKGFNGATLSQAWKQEELRDFLQQQRSFNGATLSQAWKHDEIIYYHLYDSASMGPRSLKRGNGVTSKPRERGSAASMGPRSLKRGNRSLAGGFESHPCCFNGATLSQAWKLEQAFPKVQTQDELQWGHALSSVETLE